MASATPRAVAGERPTPSPTVLSNASGLMLPSANGEMWTAQNGADKANGAVSTSNNVKIRHPDTAPQTLPLPLPLPSYPRRGDSSSSEVRTSQDPTATENADQDGSDDMMPASPLPPRRKPTTGRKNETASDTRAPVSTTSAPPATIDSARKRELLPTGWVFAGIVVVFLLLLLIWKKRQKRDPKARRDSTHSRTDPAHWLSTSQEDDDDDLENRRRSTSPGSSYQLWEPRDRQTSGRTVSEPEQEDRTLPRLPSFISQSSGDSESERENG